MRGAAPKNQRKIATRRNRRPFRAPRRPTQVKPTEGRNGPGLAAGNVNGVAGMEVVAFTTQASLGTAQAFVKWRRRLGSGGARLDGGMVAGVA